MLISACDECFCLTKIIGTINVKTVCNIKPKFSFVIPGPKCDFLVLDLRSWISGLRFWVVDIVPQVLGSGSWVLGPKSWVPGKILQSVTGITNM